VRRSRLGARVLGLGWSEPLPGHSEADCDPLATDDLEHTVTWRGEATIAPPGRPVRVRFSFAGDADLPRLYGYRLAARNG